MSKFFSVTLTIYYALEFQVFLTTYSTWSLEWPDPDEKLRKAKKKNKKRRRQSTDDSFIINDDDDESDIETVVAKPAKGTIVSLSEAQE